MVAAFNNSADRWRWHLGILQTAALTLPLNKQPFESELCEACLVSQRKTWTTDICKMCCDWPQWAENLILSNEHLTESHSNLAANCHCCPLKGQEVMLRWVLFALLLGICASAGEQEKKKAKRRSADPPFFKHARAPLSISRMRAWVCVTRRTNNLNFACHWNDLW